MAKKGNYICSKCGKDCGNPPALTLHEHYCKSKKEEKPNKCEHEFRLLNPSAPAEEKALIAGYIQVCKKCEELE